jgi:hypothetical protein
MDADTDRIFDRSWVHGFLLKPRRSFLLGNPEARNGLLKNSAGRRCEQKAPRKRFLAQPDGQHGIGRVLRKQHSFSTVH